MAVALAVSALVAVKTGEAQDERVERVVAEAPLLVHEEMAETFLTASAVVALLAAAGLVGGVVGKIARPVTALASLALVLGALRVGHSGGQLVYRFGAANAYVAGAGASAQASSGGDDDERHR
jgi:hypothetical protein